MDSRDTSNILPLLGTRHKMKTNKTQHRKLEGLGTQTLPKT